MKRIPEFLLALDIVICIWATIDGGNRPNRHFVEGELITWLNALQIAVTAGLALLVYIRRRGDRLRTGESAHFWILVAIGSVYLAIDEVATIHETIGHYMQDHHYPRPPLLNGYGDIVLVVYGLLAVLICWLNRAELRRNPRSFRFLLIATAFLVVSEILDFFGVHEGRERFWWSVWEESCKLTGFGGMLGGVLLRLMEPAHSPETSAQEVGAAEVSS